MYWKWKNGLVRKQSSKRQLRIFRETRTNVHHVETYLSCLRNKYVMGIHPSFNCKRVVIWYPVMIEKAHCCDRFEVQFSETPSSVKFWNICQLSPQIIINRNGFQTMLPTIPFHGHTMILQFFDTFSQLWTKSSTLANLVTLADPEFGQGGPPEIFSEILPM